MTPALAASHEVADLYTRALALACRFGEVRSVLVTSGRIPGHRYLRADVTVAARGDVERMTIHLVGGASADVTIIFVGDGAPRLSAAAVTAEGAL